MNLTFGDIWSIATSLVGRTDYGSSELSLLGNEAYEEVATRIRYDGVESVATSTLTTNAFRIALPTDFSYVVSLSNRSNPLEPPGGLPPADPTTFDSRSTFSGTPQAYGLYASWMEVWPSLDTDATFQLRYVQAPQPLMSSSSTPGIQARWHRGIAYKLGELLAAARNDLDQEEVCRARYLSFMGSTPTDTALRQQGRGQRVVLKRYSA